MEVKRLLQGVSNNPVVQYMRQILSAKAHSLRERVQLAAAKFFVSVGLIPIALGVSCGVVLGGLISIPGIGINVIASTKIKGDSLIAQIARAPLLLVGSAFIGGGIAVGGLLSVAGIGLGGPFVGFGAFLFITSPKEQVAAEVATAVAG